MPCRVYVLGLACVVCHSTGIPQSATCNLQSTIYNLQSTIYNLQSTIYNLQSTICRGVWTAHLVPPLVRSSESWNRHSPGPPHPRESGPFYPPNMEKLGGGGPHGVVTDSPSRQGAPPVALQSSSTSPSPSRARPPFAHEQPERHPWLVPRQRTNGRGKGGWARNALGVGWLAGSGTSQAFPGRS
ncbi:uncharacterized protein N7482_010187 [Penicillium canariense]|uniref:Uncharacterized protein n=1 Tax=Penicillium canariense TaxID=189055 RepID=A0A9W9LE91_9EURO|nr:uncharacterized protein N7482_010187 [Penicillium canariense]KAJ5150935.1 hypothetical protein N7482_010187 [Penicillium canariense]